MHYPKFFVALADFTLANSCELHTYHGHVVGLRWGYTDIEVGDLVKYAPTGIITIFRQGALIAQEHVTGSAVRAFVRIRWIQTV